MKVLEQTFREQSEGKVKQVAPLRFMNRGMRMVVGSWRQNKNGLRVMSPAASLWRCCSNRRGNLLALMVTRTASCVSARRLISH
jgi:hypothetical protein